MLSGNSNSFQPPNVLPTAIAGANSVYVDMGNQLINIVDNSKNYEQAANRVSNMNASDARKQSLLKELREYYNN